MAVLSRLAVSSFLPSGLKATPSTQSECYSTVCSSLACASPADRSQTRTCRSQPPAASCLPSGLEREAQDRIVGVQQLRDQHLRIVDAVEVGDTVLRLLRAVAQVVNADIAFLSRPAAGDGQLAVGQEDEGVRPLRPRADPLDQFAGRGVPDGQFVMPAGDEAFAVRRERQGGDDHRQRILLRRGRRLPALAEFAEQVGVGGHVGVELGPLLDPLADDGDLGRRQCPFRRRNLVLGRRRHPLGRRRSSAARSAGSRPALPGAIGSSLAPP